MATKRSTSTPGTAGTLTEKQAKALTGIAGATVPALYPMAPNLFLQVTPAGSKSFLFKMKRTAPETGKQDRLSLGLGSWDTEGNMTSTAKRLCMTWAGAIGYAATLKSEASKGIDPREYHEAYKKALTGKTDEELEAEAIEAARKATERSKRITVHDACMKFLDLNPLGNRDLTNSYWQGTFTKHIFPTLGKKWLHLVTRDDVLAIVRPIWIKHHDTAKRVAQRLEVVIKWATHNGYADKMSLNPARYEDNLEWDLMKTAKVEQKREEQGLKKEPRVLHFKQVPAFYFDLRSHTGDSAWALRFKMLTLMRTTEVRAAQWQEFDLEAGTWTVPKARMKGHREDHTVALSQAAIALLKSMPGGVKKAGNVFTSSRGLNRGKPACLSRHAMRSVMLRMGYSGLATPHGMRHAFRTWAADQVRFNPAVCEAVLAHIEGTKIEKTYTMHEHIGGGNYLEHRFEVMEAWAAFVMSGTKGTNVVPLAKPRERSTDPRNDERRRRYALMREAERAARAD